MNRIRNPLGSPESLPFKFEHIAWETRDKKAKTNTMHYSVPVIKENLDAQLAAILQQYFELLFLHLHLENRFKKHRTKLRKDAESLYRYMFSDKGTLDRKKLLHLLLDDPRKNMDPLADNLNSNKKAKNAISKVFDYNYLRSAYRDEFAAFIELLGVNVCPYCGRNFTTTVKRENGSFIRTNQVDHYLPKSEYPWLALSLWNWIPACGSCNNRKGNRTDPILYPYAEEMGDTYRFRTHPDTGLDYLTGARDSEDEFVIAIEKAETPGKSDIDFDERTENEIEMLGLNALYSVHNAYVSNIFRQRYIFGTPYIDSLLNSFPELFHTREDVRAMLYMKHISAESIGSEPLDKLTRDINSEIDQLTEEDTV